MEILTILMIAIVVNVFLSLYFISKRFADLYQEKSELEEANKKLDEVIKTQAKQIEELNAKLLSKKRKNRRKR